MDDQVSDLLTACRILDGERLTDAFGHVSARAGREELLITPKLGPGLVRTGGQLLRLRLDGELIDGDFSLLPAEAAIHRGIVAARDDVGAVCRFHGSACMAWATLDSPLTPTIGPGLALGASVPVHDRSRTVTTDEEAAEVASTLGSGYGVFLRGFGAVTVGRNVAEAVIRATALERSAAATLAASAVGEPRSYPQEVVDELYANDVVLVGQIQRQWRYLSARHSDRPAVTQQGTESTSAEQREESMVVDEAIEDSIWLELMGGGVQERHYDAGGVRTRVLEAGEGPPLLLLHGTGGHAESFYRNIVPLSDRFRVLAADMVGHGFTERPDIEYSLDDFADHIVDLLDALEIERAHISGESLGAAVAAWLAIKRPERVERLVLNTAVLALPTPEGLAELEEFARRTVEVMSGGFTLDAVRTRMQWLVADPSRMPEELVRVRHAVYSQPGMLETVGKVMMSVGGMFRGMSGQQYFEEGVMSRIGCPTMVLWTEHNPGQSAEFAREAAAEIPDHSFHVITDCGHWPQFERPEEFNRLHVEFLLSEQPASTA